MHRAIDQGSVVNPHLADNSGRHKEDTTNYHIKLMGYTSLVLFYKEVAIVQHHKTISWKNIIQQNISYGAIFVMKTNTLVTLKVSQLWPVLIFTFLNTTFVAQDKKQ